MSLEADMTTPRSWPCMSSYLSVSRSAEFMSHGVTSDNLNAIHEVGYQADDSALAPQVGAHGS
jgi:hypothetical protein